MLMYGTTMFLINTVARPLTSPLVHPAIVRTAMFHPDGNALLTGALDGVRVWDITADTRSLDDWRRLARDSAFPQLRETLESLIQ